MSAEHPAAHTVKDSRSSEESKQTPAVLGSRGEKPAAAVTPDASQCDSEGATGSASQSSAAKRRVTKAELEAALAALLDAEWMVTCDWTTPDKREPILAEARRVLGRDDG